MDENWLYNAFLGFSIYKIPYKQFGHINLMCNEVKRSAVSGIATR